MAGGRKLAGILTEMAAEMERVQWVVLGLGINVNGGTEDFPPELRAIATTLAAERGSPVPRVLFTAALLATLEGWLDRHAAEGFEPVRAAWRELSGTLGREVRVRNGQEELTGRAEDIDEAGALLVRTASGVQRVLAGDVEVLR
jgi:BirA family biotin operon repressor/biotin-[acetyl-CoA-carboxylase] ligase